MSSNYKIKIDKYTKLKAHCPKKTISITLMISKTKWQEISRLFPNLLTKVKNMIYTMTIQDCSINLYIIKPDINSTQRPFGYNDIDICCLVLSNEPKYNDHYREYITNTNTLFNNVKKLVLDSDNEFNKLIGDGGEADYEVLSSVQELLDICVEVCTNNYNIMLTKFKKMMF